MFLTLEVNFIFITTLFFFVSLFLINFTNKNSFEKYNFTFYYFILLFFNFFLYAINSPFSYTFLDIFYSDFDTLIIKLTLIVFQALFIIFIIISYKYYLKPEITLFFNLSLSSALFISTTSDFIITFVLLELSSIPLYTLIALPKNRFAIEAAIKYLIFGSLASQLFILGFVFYSIMHGSNFISDIHFSQIFSANIKQDNVFTVFFFASIFIKFGVGPFYSWLIDVYQASSFPLFLYNSTVSKLITFIPLITIGKYFSGNSPYSYFFVALLLYSSFHAAINMFFQNNIRRFFGYSSVINFSFLIIVNFFDPYGPYILFKYLTFYILMLFFIFFIFDIYRVTNFARLEPEVIDDLSKNSNTYMSLFFCSSFIFSSGLPPIGIFYAKAYIYGVLLISNNLFDYAVVVILIVNSILALFGYFRIISKIYNFANPSSKFLTAENDESFALVQVSVFIIFIIIFISFNWNYFVAF